MTIGAAGLMVQTWSELHIGVGQSPGTVDLPLNREILTGWPVIPGSGLKGALRATVRQNLASECTAPSKLDLSKANDTELITRLFGPSSRHAGNHAGAVSFGDAVLLLWPVRTLRGTFALATCRGAIERLNRLRDVGGLAPLPEPPAVKQNEAACPDERFLEDGRVVVEDFVYKPVRKEETLRWAKEFAAALCLPNPVDLERIICLHDAEFTHFASRGAIIRTHNALDYTTKNVQHGKLFQCETVPPETVFATLLLAHADRLPGQHGSSADVLLALKKALFPKQHESAIIYMGGNVTTGQGICAISAA